MLWRLFGSYDREVEDMKEERKRYVKRLRMDYEKALRNNGGVENEYTRELYHEWRVQSMIGVEF